jgi:hypothetical protein
LFEDKAVARTISDLMLDMGRKLNTSLAQVQENCSAPEFERYRKIVGQVMGEMLVEVMSRIYSKHPELDLGELE